VGGSVHGFSLRIVGTTLRGPLPFGSGPLRALETI
jgi:hypothetical protein